jgi:hypothetical protein
MPAAILSVAFTLSRMVGPTPPTLEVAWTNESDEPVGMVSFASEQCFAHFYLQAWLTLPDGKELEADVPCPIRSFPGVKTELAAHATDKKSVKLETLFPQVKWKTGYYRLSLDWQPYPLKQMFDGGFAPLAKVSTGTSQELTLANVLGKVTVKRGVEAKLPDGARLSFRSHGHKHTMVGGPESPLIIHGAFAKPGGKPEEFDVSVHVSESRMFTLGGGYMFALGKYEYDGFMELEYFGRIPPPPD